MKDYAFFEELKEGSVWDKMVEYSELKLNQKEKERLDAVIHFHETFPYTLPKMDNLAKFLDYDRDKLRKEYNDLIKKEENALIKVTFPQIFKAFGYWKDFRAYLPRNLDIATQGELRKLRGTNFKKLDKTSNKRHGFYLAIVKKVGDNGNKAPVLGNIFNFLPNDCPEINV